MSLYKDYIIEKTNDYIIETDKGFMTYSYQNDNVWIKDVYVKPEYRQFGIAGDMAKQVIAEAKEKGVHILYTSVVPTLKDSTESIKAIIAFGFKIDSATNNFIAFKMEL